MLISSSLLSAAQPGIVNYYAWKQPAAKSGIKNTQVNEKNEVLVGSSKYEQGFRIFLDMNKRSPVKVDLIWLDGKAYKVKETIQVSDAIIYKTAGLGTNFHIDTLAPATRKLRKEIGIGAAVKQSIIVPIYYKSQDIVLAYWWKGKRHFYALRNFKELPELVLE